VLGPNGQTGRAVYLIGFLPILPLPGSVQALRGARRKPSDGARPNLRDLVIDFFRRRVNLGHI
jgi:hypothetical protein